MKQRIINARNRHFPGWYKFNSSIPNDLQPIYKVVCETWRDYIEAKVAKPRFVKAEIIHQPPKRIVVNGLSATVV